MTEIKPDEKKVIKYFISQPMKDKTDEEIQKVRDLVAYKVQELYPGKKLERIDSFFKGAPHDAKPLWFLGEAVKRLADADLIVMADDWYNYRGCNIEYEIALKYGIDIEYMDWRRNMNIGQAINAAKYDGCRIAREGWNGKNMFIVYQKGYPEGIPCNEQTAEAWGLVEGELFKCNPYLQIKNQDGSHSMWAPSIGDTLAEDWFVYPD